jgi:RHS repeat-associated protein
MSLSVGANNRVSSFGYDAAGNTLNDGVYTYAWNAESEMSSSNAGVNYIYDGDGNRIEKSNGKIYWYGAGTEILDESDASGNITNEYVFFGGKRVAMRVVSSGTTYYYAEDFLGSSRAMVQASQTSPCFDADFYPFGGERDVVTTCNVNAYKFEGKERDAETGNDDFGARYYSNRFGRWESADWSAVPAPVPYANLANPQTLNLYTMVEDDPETFADLDGHQSPCPTHGTQDCGEARMRSEAAGNRAICEYGGTTVSCESLVNTQSKQTSSGQFVKDEALGMAKEAANTVISITNLVDDAINAVAGTHLQYPEFSGSTPGEKSAMLGTSIGLMLIPGTGEAKAPEAAKLAKSLASESQTAEGGFRIAGAGAKTALRDAQRLVSEYGGKTSDWAKMSSTSYRPSGAAASAAFETHWYQNVATGLRVEYKTIMGWMK